MEPDGVVLGFFIFWMILVFANMIFMFTSRNAALKRRVAGIGVIAVGILMIAVLLVLSRQTWLALVTAPFVVLAGVFNARQIRLCDACGMTNVLRNPFKSEAFCSDCGKPLDLKRWAF